MCCCGWEYEEFYGRGSEGEVLAFVIEGEGYVMVATW